MIAIKENSRSGFIETWRFESNNCFVFFATFATFAPWRDTLFFFQNDSTALAGWVFVPGIRVRSALTPPDNFCY